LLRCGEDAAVVGGLGVACFQHADGFAARTHLGGQPQRRAQVGAHMAVAGQQHHATVGVLLQHLRHELVACHLGQRHASGRGGVEHAAVAGFDVLGLRLQHGRGHLGAEAGSGQAAAHHLAGLVARHVGRDDGQPMLERQRDEGAVVLPQPALATGRGDQRIGVGSRCLRQQAVDERLLVAVELFQRQRRARAAGQPGAQGVQPQRVLGGVVVHLAQQHHRAAEAQWRRGGRRAAGDERNQRGAGCQRGRCCPQPRQSGAGPAHGFSVCCRNCISVAK
jgi:hypothetical protein